MKCLVSFFVLMRGKKLWVIKSQGVLPWKLTWHWKIRMFQPVMLVFRGGYPKYRFNPCSWTKLKLKFRFFSESKLGNPSRNLAILRVRDLFGIAFCNPFKGCKHDLQRLGIKRSRPGISWFYLPSLKLTAKTPENWCLVQMFLSYWKIVPFSGAFAVSFREGMGASKNYGTPKSSILIGSSMK